MVVLMVEMRAALTVASTVALTAALLVVWKVGKMVVLLADLN
jgi:hypothetical protein